MLDTLAPTCRFGTVRANKEQPGDIQFPHGDQVHAVLRRPNQRRLSSPEYVRRLNGEEEAHVGRDVYRSAFGTETAYGCCKNQRTIALSKLGPTLIELKRKYKWFVGERVNGKPQPLIDAGLDGNIINVVDEAGVAETTAVNGGQVAGETMGEGPQQQQQQNGNGNGMMTTGCSARANGLELDIRITDPVKLERSLKRQRSEADGDASTDSHALEKGDAKGPKPAPGALDRLMNLLDPLLFRRQDHSSSTNTIYHVIRFARDERQPSALPRAPLPQRAVLIERREGRDSAVAIPTLRKQTTGFDPFLLKPVSPSEPIFHHQRSLTPGHIMANGSSSSIPPQPIQDLDPSNPVFTPPAAP
ncbi:hypothetical protein JOM56_015210 [Amanita muscaria]